MKKDMLAKRIGGMVSSAVKSLVMWVCIFFQLCFMFGVICLGIIFAEFPPEERRSSDESGTK